MVSKHWLMIYPSTRKHYFLKPKWKSSHYFIVRSLLHTKGNLEYFLKKNLEGIRIIHKMTDCPATKQFFKKQWFFLFLLQFDGSMKRKNASRQYPYSLWNPNLPDRLPIERALFPLPRVLRTTALFRLLPFPRQGVLLAIDRLPMREKKSSIHGLSPDNSRNRPPLRPRCFSQWGNS